MSVNIPSSYREILVQREQVFRAALANGEIEPFIYPWDTVPAGILVLALLFLPYRNSGYSKWLFQSAFLIIVLSCAAIMRRSRSVGLAGGYGIGLMCVWGIVWSAVLLIYNDPKTAFQRLERRDKREQSIAISQSNGAIDPDKLSRSSLSNRSVDGVVGGAQKRTDEDQNAEEQSQSSAYVLFWQSYPDNLRHRFDWVVDLCTSLRGTGWNWRVQTLPGANYPSVTMPTTPPSPNRLSARTAIRDVLLWYILLDIVKTVTMNDPYSWGVISITTPPPANIIYFPRLLTSTPPLLKTYRLLLVLAGVVASLTLIFSLSPLYFGIIKPRLNMDKNTRAPLREPLLYPPFWGNFTTTVIDKGLAGWWGKWWHQMFRMGFSEPSRVLVKKLGWDPRSQRAKILQLLIAFTISGIIHAGASYTTFHRETEPLRGPFAFFFAQAFGILAEQFVFQTLGISNLMQSWPRALRRAGTLGYVLVWFYFTGPWLADDFARGGIWLFEPVPISLMRGLGFGAEGEGWWCWHGQWAMWWSGREGTPWWRKGVAF